MEFIKLLILSLVFLSHHVFAFNDEDIIGSQRSTTYYENSTCSEMIEHHNQIETALARQLEAKTYDLQLCLKEIPHIDLPVLGNINLAFNSDQKKEACIKKYYDPMIEKIKMIKTDFNRALTVKKEIYDVLNIKDKSKFIKGLPCNLNKNSFDRKSVHSKLNDSDYIKRIIGNCVVRNENDLNLNTYNKSEYKDRNICLKYIHDHDDYLKEQFKRGIETQSLKQVQKPQKSLLETDPAFCEKIKNRVFFNPNDQLLKYECLLKDSNVNVEKTPSVNKKKSISGSHQR